VLELKILVETVVMKGIRLTNSRILTPLYAIPQTCQRPTPEYRMAPRIPQAGDLSPDHVRNGYGKAIYPRGHTALSRHIVRFVFQCTPVAGCKQNAIISECSHLPHLAMEAKAASRAVVLVQMSEDA